MKLHYIQRMLLHAFKEHYEIEKKKNEADKKQKEISSIIFCIEVIDTALKENVDGIWKNLQRLIEIDKNALDPNISFMISLYYFFELGLEYDPILFDFFLQKAVQAELVLAKAFYGFVLASKEKKQDIELGLQLLQTAADQGLGLAQLFLYIHRDSLIQKLSLDPKKILSNEKLLENAGAAGFSWPQTSFASLLFFDKDLAEKKEVDLLGSLAAKGIAFAEFLYGIHLMGREETHLEGLSFIKKAVEQKEDHALLVLGGFYRAGTRHSIAIAQDLHRAIQYYCLSAERGMTEALINLKECHDFDRKNTKEAIEQALITFRAEVPDYEALLGKSPGSMTLGTGSRPLYSYAHARYNLAFCLFHGLGSENDNESDIFTGSDRKESAIKEPASKESKSKGSESQGSHSKENENKKSESKKTECKKTETQGSNRKQSYNKENSRKSSKHGVETTRLEAAAQLMILAAGRSGEVLNGLHCDERAAFHVGYLYEWGIGVQRRPLLMLRYYNMARKHGFGDKQDEDFDADKPDNIIYRKLCLGSDVWDPLKTTLTSCFRELASSFREQAIEQASCFREQAIDLSSTDIPKTDLSSTDMSRIDMPRIDMARPEIINEIVEFAFDQRIQLFDIRNQVQRALFFTDSFLTALETCIREIAPLISSKMIINHIAEYILGVMVMEQNDTRETPIQKITGLLSDYAAEREIPGSGIQEQVQGCFFMFNSFSESDNRQALQPIQQKIACLVGDYAFQEEEMDSDDQHPLVRRARPLFHAGT